MFLTACSAAFDAVVGAQGTLYGRTFSQIEERAGICFRKLAALLCEARLALDPLGNPEREFGCPKCGRRMRVQSPAQDRTLGSTLGAVKMVRPYCVCDGCDFSCAPLDYALGIPAHGASVGRRELISHAATQNRSFEKGQETLRRHDKIHLSAEAIRKLAESEGRRLIERRRDRVEKCFQRPGPIPEKPCRHAEALLVVVCDGGMVQTRDKEEPWKSDKIGCVYNARAEPNGGATTHEEYRGAVALTKTYVATMEPWAELARMLYTEACQRGYRQAQQKLFLSDAAEAIMQLRAEHFPDAQWIIDWYHASQHVYECGKAAFGCGTQDGMRWAKEVTDLLWRGEVGRVIQSVGQQSQRLGSHPKGTPDSDPRVVLHRGVGYFTRNQEEMDYPAYRAKGWPIGSGVAEGSVKQFGLRVKGSEQYWNLEGAEEMLALCELLFSEDGRWDQYWRLRGEAPADAALWR